MSAYSSVTITGYNATPPSDDGSQTSANEVTWAKHTGKIGDPLKTAIEAINTNLVALDTFTTLNTTTLNQSGVFTLTGSISFPTTTGVTDCIDDDTMATASATKLATSESIKAYVDSQGGAFSSALFHMEDQKTSGTPGGTFTSGAWQTRTINTSITNEITGASLSSNQITLPAGTYFIEARASARNVNSHMARLYNTSDSALVISGTSEYAVTSGGNHATWSEVSGRFTLASTKTLELQHQCQTTQATTGYGTNTSFTVDHETYAVVKIWKVG